MSGVQPAKAVLRVRFFGGDFAGIGGHIALFHILRYGFVADPPGDGMHDRFIRFVGDHGYIGNRGILWNERPILRAQSGGTLSVVGSILLKCRVDTIRILRI